MLYKKIQILIFLLDSHAFWQQILVDYTKDNMPTNFLPDLSFQCGIVSIGLKDEMMFYRDYLILTSLIEINQQNYKVFVLIFQLLYTTDFFLIGSSLVAK